MKKQGIIALAVTCGILLSGCGASGSSDTVENGSVSNGSTITATETGGDTSSNTTAVSDMFTDRDLETGYDESSAAVITLSGTSAQCSSNAVTIDGSTVTITDEGTYILTGSLENGMIIVEADDTDKLQLVLNGVDINCNTSAAIYVRSADKVFITMASGSENTLTNGGEYVAIDDNNIDSVIFSKEDLTLNGNGIMNITATAGHGIVSKDDLVVTSGTYNITAAKNGISGKDSVRVSDGVFNITSENDGLHSENADDTALGFVYIAGGTFNITATCDGISASNYAQIDGGEYTITSGGGAQNAQQHVDSMGGGFPFNSSDSSSSDDTTSAKGIKASGNLILNSGTFSIDSADDSLHTNADLTVSGGTYQIASGDDGLHADASLYVTGGSITISTSYEGIEGNTIELSGGNIELTASDDGLNAAGGNDQSGFGGMMGQDNFSGSSASILISGGTIYINAGGDGIDSNGSLTVTGGETYVFGPEDNGNGALDYTSSASITGGTLVALGSSGMAQNFDTSSTQGSILVSVTAQTSGGTVSLTDSSGNLLISCSTDKSFDSVLISCPAITEGSTYTLTAGSSETQIEMSSLIYGSSSGMGGMGGGMGNTMPSGDMGGQRPDKMG